MIELRFELNVVKLVIAGWYVVLFFVIKVIISPFEGDVVSNRNYACVEIWMGILVDFALVYCATLIV